jgi:hypothetical protein
MSKDVTLPLGTVSQPILWIPGYAGHLSQAVFVFWMEMGRQGDEVREKALFVDVYVGTLCR